MTTSDNPARARRAWGSLSEEQIVAAALALARKEGLAAVNIRRLASELNASRMAIYRHVKDKEALLDRAAGAITEHDIPLPDIGEGDWEQQLRSVARAVRASLARYPGLAELLLSRGLDSRAALAIADACIGLLMRAGMDAETAGRCYVALVDVVVARAQREAAAGTEGPEQRLRRQLAAARTLDAASIPFLTEALPALERITAEDVAETELDLLIAGFRELAEAPAQRGQGRGQRRPPTARAT
jgi:TetR/AcrR family transcriptional regulator, tetracycline repressor protein